MSGRAAQPWPNHNRNSSSSAAQAHHRVGNVFHLLAQREVSPRTKCCPKRQWGKFPDHHYQPGIKGSAVRDARRGLYTWVEAESTRHLSGEYCMLEPSPRSTIAAAFSCDGKALASTHGDHTVKIIDCQSGQCLKVLSGHRRTPWVVRFHPRHPAILASGSLDHEVRLWDLNKSECIGSCRFYRPIASIAFHAEGELLAVASGHKLYFWHYNQRGDASPPTSVLKTRRSLRAVHFHPLGGPFLLTAEVNDLDTSDSSVARATSLGGLNYPPPSLYMSNVQSSDHRGLAAELPLMPLPFVNPLPFARDDLNEDRQEQSGLSDINRIQEEASTSAQFIEKPNNASHEAVASSRHAGVDDTSPNNSSRAMLCSSSEIDVGTMIEAELQHVKDSQGSSFSGQDTSLSQSCYNLPSTSDQPDRISPPRSQEWNLAESACQQQPPHYGLDSAILRLSSLNCNRELPEASVSGSMNRQMLSDTSSSGGQLLGTQFIFSPAFGEDRISNSNPRERVNNVPTVSRIESGLSLPLAASVAAELPCTVKLRIWSQNKDNSCAPLSTENCRLSISHAVLCSEMGTHFSPCGRYLATCVACILPQMEADPELGSDFNQDAGDSATSPTRHPIRACRFIYELRIYSLEEPTFGAVLVSREIRAAHCLTSIQFSPTSEHLLLAYGRRHCSLLKSIVINGEASLPIYTVLEVYRVSDLELVSVLPSAEDEVNVACFHPLAGGGLVYGTKEGKLRVLQCDRVDHDSNAGLNLFPEANVREETEDWESSEAHGTRSS